MVAVILIDLVKGGTVLENLMRIAVICWLILRVKCLPWTEKLKNERRVRQFSISD